MINSLIPSTNHSNSLTDIFYLWKTPVAQYWFIYILFFEFVIWTLLSSFLKNYQIMLLLFAVGFFSSIFGWQIPYIGTMVSMAFPFGLGTCIHKYYIDRWKLQIKAFFIFLHILVVSVLIWYDLDNFIIDKIEVILGISASIAMVSIIRQLTIVEKFLLFICRFSFPVYLLHTIFTAGIRIIMLKLGFDNFVLHMVAGFAIGIAVPCCIAMVSDKCAFWDIFFFPSKNIKRLKKRI